MSDIARKVAELFGKPETTTKTPLPVVPPCPAPSEPNRPYLTEQGELRIPFESDPKYHWWKPGGQSIALTLDELNAPDEVLRRYCGSYTKTKH